MNKSFIGKKLLSLLLSVLMCLSLIPTVALATTAEGETGSEATKGSSSNPYTLEEFGAMTRENYIAVQESLGGTMYVNVGEYSYDTNGVLGNGVRVDSAAGADKTDLNCYAANGYKGDENDGANGKTVVFTGTSISNNVTGYKDIDNIGTSLLLAVPAYTTVKFEKIKFNGVFSFDYQLYTSPWSQLQRIEFNNCEFNGLIVGGIAATELAFVGCTFKEFTNTVDANNSNPTWIRPAYGNWTKGDNEGQGEDFKSLTKITFTNNTVKSTRPVKFERISQWDITSNITVDGNNFDITNTDNSYKNVGMYLGFNAAANLVMGNNRKSENTAALYTVVYNKGSALPDGSTVKDLNGNDVVITDAVEWKTTNTITIKTPTDNFVAKIGEAEYKTLAEAIAAAKDGDTVTLLANCSGDGIRVATNKYPTGITIDFAGYSYTVGGKLVGSTGTASNGFQLLAGNTITMKNGFIYGDASVAGDDITKWSGAPAIMIQNYSNLTLDNMTVSGGKQTVYTISNNNGNTVIKDSIIKAGNADGISRYPFAFDVCRYSSYPSVSVTVEGNSVINGNIEISGGIGKGQSRQLNIKNGTFNGKFSVESNVPANIAISGGKFAYEINPDYCADGFIPTTNKDGTYGVKSGKYVAELNGVKYETVNAAIAAANNGDTVTLLSDTTEDVLISKSITLDLGGKTLTNTGVGKATTSITVNNVTVKNGNVIGGASYYNIEVKKGASATLEDVTATAGNTGSSMVDNWGTLTINSGTYTGGLNTVKSEEGSMLTITGGKFVSDYAPKYNITGTILVYGDTIITGGEFIQNSTSTAARVVVTGIVEGYTAKTVITGGNFTNRSSGAIFHGLGKATWDNFEVSGGTFNKKISDGYCADGYIPTKNNDGTYGVKEGSYVAQIGTKKYETLADAIRLAAKGKTITLLADIEVNSTLSIAKNLIIDLNGKTLTGKTGSYMFNIAEAASVTFENGTINVADNYGAMNVYGQLSLQNVNIEGAAIESSLLLINGNANVTVDKDTTVSANANVKDCFPAILFEPSGEAHNPVLKVYGTVKAIKMPAIQGNGSDKGTTDIYIYDGAKVLSDKLAMYLPQLCNVNITGGLVEGYCGIGIKSGTLNISGGEVRGVCKDDVIDDKYSQTNGISYDGSAILIDSYVGYAGQVKINISGNAVVRSKYSTAIREIGNDASKTNVVAIGISGGQILGADGKQAVLVRETSVSMVSISGGTFSSAVPADYCAAGYAPKDNGDGTYGVEHKAATGTRNLSVEINGYGTVDYSIIGGVSGTWDNSITNVPYEIGTQFTLKAIPGDGFTFLYWVNSEGRVLTDNLTYNFYLGDNLTIKAVFCKTENSNAHVIFRDRGNTILKATSADSEGYIDVPTNLIDYAGYTFIGWYDADGKEYIVTDGKIQVSGNTAITIYARYKADTETVYTVTVDGIEKGKYTYGSYVTVTAEDIEGKEFAGWYINGTLVSYDKAYSFYVTGDVALEARYSDTAVVKEPVITLLVGERKDMANGKQSVILTASWSADSSYTFVGAGIILSQNADTALTLENVDGKNVVKTDTRLTSNEGTYAYTLTLGTTAKLKNVYAVAYFTFIKDGKVVTIYTAVQTA